LGSSAASDDMELGDEASAQEFSRAASPVKASTVSAEPAAKKAYKPASKPAKTASFTDDEGVGEVALKDEEPFEDDLPF
jgi:hypothetical protein